MLTRAHTFSGGLAPGFGSVDSEISRTPTVGVQVYQGSANTSRSASRNVDVTLRNGAPHSVRPSVMTSVVGSSGSKRISAATSVLAATLPCASCMMLLHHSWTDAERQMMSCAAPRCAGSDVASAETLRPRGADRRGREG